MRNSTDYLTQGESKYLTVQLGFLVSVYSLTLLFTVCNIHNYLFKQKRWRIIMMLAFYVCVTCILVFRLVSLVYFIFYFQSNLLPLTQVNCKQYLIANQTDTVATYAKAILGIF